VAKVISSGGATQETIFQFLQAMDGAKFLFGPEIINALNAINKPWAIYQSSVQSDRKSVRNEGRVTIFEAWSGESALHWTKLSASTQHFARC
jgi:hypothetical protein